MPIDHPQIVVVTLPRPNGHYPLGNRVAADDLDSDAAAKVIP